MPSAESGGTGNFWYSFDYGMTHYVQFDTETDLGHGLIAPDSPEGGTEDSGPFAVADAQANWLAADLANVNRSKTPWVVVYVDTPYIHKINRLTHTTVLASMYFHDTLFFCFRLST